MSFQLLTAAAKEYKDNIQMLSQQMGSRLRSAVTEANYTGSDGGVPVEQFGSADAAPAGPKFSDLTPTDLEQDRRWVYPSPWEIAFWIDTFEKAQVRIQPQGPYTKAATESMNRQIDDFIIAAFSADAKTGKTGSTTTSFPAGNIIPAGGTGLTVDKLKQANKTFLANEVDLASDQRFISVTAAQNDDLLHQAEMIRDEYVVKPRVNAQGVIESWLGFNFIHSERLLLDDSDDRLNPVWVRSGMHLGVWNDLSTAVDRLPNKSSQPIQIYASLQMGATRIEEKKVLLITSVEG